MSATPAAMQPVRRRYRRRQRLIEAGSVVLVIAILIWSLAPIYNMFRSRSIPRKGKSSLPVISGRPSRRSKASAMS